MICRTANGCRPQEMESGLKVALHQFAMDRQPQSSAHPSTSLAVVVDQIGCDEHNCGTRSLKVRCLAAKQGG